MKSEQYLDTLNEVIYKMDDKKFVSITTPTFRQVFSLTGKFILAFLIWSILWSFVILPFSFALGLGVLGR